MIALSLPILLSLLTPQAQAEDCEVGALMKAVDEASPQATPRAYSALAACDGAMAKRAAKAALPRMIAGKDAYEATSAAISAGASAEAQAWMAGLQSDERAKAIRFLGKKCADPAVPQFFLNLAETNTEAFWEDRWYTALGNCRVPEVQGLLWTELEKGIGEDRGRFFGIVETFARSQGKDAVPKLKLLVGKVEDAEAQTNVVGAFADAAHVGSVDGMDEGTAQLAIAAIVELAPSLEAKAVEQGRITLTAMGAEREADSLAAVRYKDVKQKDGTYMWGVVVKEFGTCKNGKEFQRFWHAPVMDPGNTWPDQIKEKAEAAVGVGWEMDMAERCKGEGAQKVLVPGAPFADEAAYKAWSDEKLDELKGEAKKPAILAQEPVKL